MFHISLWKSNRPLKINMPIIPSPHPLSQPLIHSATFPSHLMTNPSFHLLSPKISSTQFSRISYSILAKIFVPSQNTVETFNVIFITLFLICIFVCVSFPFLFSYTINSPTIKLGTYLLCLLSIQHNAQCIMVRDSKSQFKIC